MGAYIYSLRSKTRSALVDGITTQVGRLTYAGKPYGSSLESSEWASPAERKYNASVRRTLATAERTWRDRQTPSLVVMGDDDADAFCEFNAVMGPWKGGLAWSWDTPDFTGSPRTVGYLRRAGRGWAVSRTYIAVERIHYGCPTMVDLGERVKPESRHRRCGRSDAAEGRSIGAGPWVTTEERERCWDAAAARRIAARMRSEHPRHGVRLVRHGTASQKVERILHEPAEQRRCNAHIPPPPPTPAEIQGDAMSHFLTQAGA